MRDQFVLQEAGLEAGSDSVAVPGPTITIQTLLDDRAAFAETQSPDIKASLLKVISPNTPLSAFMKIIVAKRLHREWEHFRASRVYSRITDWSASRGIAPLPVWFRKDTSSPSPRSILESLIREMTDEEIRDLRVSIRAVESLFKRGQILREAR
jgi:hypothetical protein